MGQKVNPIGLRLGINKTWDSSWFATKSDFAKFLLEDNKIREAIRKKYKACSISKITIERTKQKLVVNILTARPGMIIGQKGVGIEDVKKLLNKIVAPDVTLFINIKEIKKPDLDSTLIAEGVAQQLEKRVSFRRCMKQGIQRVMKAGAKGCKIQVSGVVDGPNSIARTEHYMEGSIPLHTLRADIDYCSMAAFTTSGKLGVKVWIYKGEILPSKENDEKGGQN
ncbi:MAG: 30S ribosomal protein S3 [Clostridia bacterium]